MSDTRENRIAFLLATSPHLTLVGDYTYKEAAKDFVSNGVTVQKWIPVSERLPENDLLVLTCTRDLKTGMSIVKVDRCTLTVSGDRMWLNDYTRWKQVVTHWLPLPELPE